MKNNKSGKTILDELHRRWYEKNFKPLINKVMENRILNWLNIK